MKYDWVHDTSDATTERGNPSREAAMGREVSWDNSKAGQEQATIADADSHALGEKHLIVLMADAGHHHAENIAERTQVQQRTHITCVIDWPCL